MGCMEVVATQQPPLLPLSQWCVLDYCLSSRLQINSINYSTTNKCVPLYMFHCNVILLLEFTYICM